MQLLNIQELLPWCVRSLLWFEWDVKIERCASNPSNIEYTVVITRLTLDSGKSSNVHISDWIFLRRINNVKIDII